MASRPKTSRKLEICIDAVEDSRGGYSPVISVGDVKLNLTSRLYENAEDALNAANGNFVAMLELILRNINSHILL